MSSNSSLKDQLISFFVIGIIGLIIRYLFGGEGKKSKTHEMILDVLDVFLWVFLYILIPLFVIGFIINLFQKPKEKKKYNYRLKDGKNIYDEIKSKDQDTNHNTEL